MLKNDFKKLIFTITFRIPLELKKQLLHIAKIDHMSLSTLLRTVLHDFVLTKCSISSKYKMEVKNG